MMALFTGGASCGKSALAESRCQQLGGKLVYLAAMRPFGEEGMRRVEKHRAQRAGKGFTTIECYDDFTAASHDERLAGATILLECLGNVVANELFDENAQAEGTDLDATRARIMDAIESIKRAGTHLVIVGNDVGADGIRYPSETHAYQELLGGLSCAVATRCDFVAECASGLPIVVKSSGQ